LYLKGQAKTNHGGKPIKVGSRREAKKHTVTT